MEKNNFSKLSTEQITKRLLLMINDGQTSNPLFQSYLEEAKLRLGIK